MRVGKILIKLEADIQNDSCAYIVTNCSLKCLKYDKRGDYLHAVAAGANLNYI